MSHVARNGIPYIRASPRVDVPCDVIIIVNAITARNLRYRLTGECSFIMNGFSNAGIVPIRAADNVIRGFGA